MRQLIAGNWKMNGCRSSVAALTIAVRDQAADFCCDILIAPAFVHIAPVADLLAGSPVFLGGQDCAAESDGAHTGDVSATMLRDAGAGWVILGHSERRQNRGESSTLVQRKTVSAAKAGLKIIVAIGETAAQRQEDQTESLLAEQLEQSLPDDFSGVIAYEPIWAIGSGKTPDEQSVTETILFIHHYLRRRFPKTGTNMRILYGGSVTPDNAARLLALPGVGGALVGGASLHADQFLRIVSACGLLCSGDDTV